MRKMWLVAFLVTLVGASGLYFLARDQKDRLIYLPKGSQIVRGAAGVFEVYEGPNADQVYAGLKPRLEAQGGVSCCVIVISTTISEGLSMPDGTTIQWTLMPVQSEGTPKFKTLPHGIIVAQRPLESAR